MSRKFDSQDRKTVISDVNKHLGVKLTNIGRRQKYLKDEYDKRYWVLGGYDYWHGIPSEMMESEVQAKDNATLIIAVRKKTGIDIFIGSVGPFVSGRNFLSRNAKGDYQFHLEERGWELFPKELPGTKLILLSTVDYSLESKDTDRASFLGQKNLENLFSKLSNEEKNRLLQKLSGEDRDSKNNDK